MGRRYLTQREVESALQRGRTVECFLGSCTREGIAGVRHVSIGMAGETIEMRLFETVDRGSTEFLDLYEFGPLNVSLAQGEADEVHAFASLKKCLATMEIRWPGSVTRLVNQGVLQDEYRDHIAGRAQQNQ